MNKAVKNFWCIAALAVLSVLLVKANFINTTAKHLVSRAVVDPLTQQSSNLYNKQKVDTAVSMLRSGYIVLRTGLGADSYLLSQMNRKDKTYSHCGIVMIENGYPFVYHSIGGEDNPDERLRRDSASFFFSPLHNSGLAIVQY